MYKALNKKRHRSPKTMRERAERRHILKHTARRYLRPHRGEARRPMKFLPNFNGFHYRTPDGSRRPALYLNRTPNHPCVTADQLEQWSTAHLTAFVQSLRGL